LTLPWSQVKKIRVVECQEAGAAVPYLEIVRTAGAAPVPDAFTRSATASGAADGTGHVLLAIRDWLPDRERLAEIAADAAPHVRFDTTVPPAVARAEEDRELDRSDRYFTQYGAVGPNTFRFLWRYVFGVLAWCLLGVALLDTTLPDLEAHLGAGRPGVWTAGPEHCSKNKCFVRGDFVSDDGKHVRPNMTLRDGSALYPAGHQVHVVDTGSLEYVYPPDDLGTQWPLNVGISVVLALPLGFWIWRVPVRSARQARPRAASPR
jgi:hypothetical protein